VGGSGGSSSAGIPPSTLHQLQSQGAAGKNAAALAQSGSPAGGGGAQGSNTHGSTGGQGANGGVARGGDQSNGGGTVSGVGNALAGDTGGPGIGLLLPLILGGTLVAGIAFWLMRRRAGPVS